MSLTGPHVRLTASQSERMDMDIDSVAEPPAKKFSGLRTAVVGIFCFAFFGGGYIGGYFTPRPGISTEATANAVLAKASWRDGPCPIITGDKCPAGYKKSPPLLLVSFDGFSAEYLGRSNISAFKRLQDCGVRAPSMRPSHPAVTFPNHYTIATGLYPEAHGVVENIFFDPELKRVFSYKRPDSHDSIWWKGGEPIWVTAKKQGKRANSYFYVGTEEEVQNIRPDVWMPFNESTSFPQRVDMVLEWLSRPDDQRPDLVMVYFEEPDSRGHAFGPRSVELTRVLMGKVNSALEQLMQGLYDRNILSCVNIIVLSDHGMVDVSCDKSVYVQPLIDDSFLAGKLNESAYSLYGGYSGRIAVDAFVTNVTDEEVYEALECKPNVTSRYQVYHKKDLPRRFHYANSPRIEPTILTLPAGHSVHKSSATSNWCLGGDHGYDNLYPSMQAIFLAQGPSLKSDFAIEPFQNIELYNVMCDLLNIKPAANNGTYGSLHHILRSHGTLPDLAPGKLEWPVLPNSVDEIRQRQRSCWAPCVGEDAPDRLNVSQDDIDRRLALAAPYGVPRSGEPNIVLAYRDYALGYDPALQLPAWISFSAINRKIEITLKSVSVICSSNDVRVPPEYLLSCKDFASPAGDRLQAVYLFPPGLVSTAAPADDVRLTTNIVPMYSAFLTEVWLEFWRIFNIWSSRSWKLNVITGPVFDSLYPYGLLDPPASYIFSSRFPKLRIPSHYFIIVTKDNRTSSCVANECLPSVLAFILPHTAEARPICQDIESYILTHSATVRDVERVTGLRVYSDLPQYEAIRLRTQLPTRLWHRNLGL